MLYIHIIGIFLLQLLHFDKKDTLEISLYAPFWLVNKTELTLQYRVNLFSGYNEWIVDIVVLQVSHTKDVITHKPDKKLMLFSFGNKYDGKKVCILQPNINALYLV